MYPSIPQDPIVLSAGAAFVSFTKRSRKLRSFSSFSAAPYLLASLGLNVTGCPFWFKGASKGT